MKNSSIIVFSGTLEELALFAKVLDENNYTIDPERGFNEPTQKTRTIVAYGEGEYEYGYYKSSAAELAGKFYPKSLEEAIACLN